MAFLLFGTLIVRMRALVSRLRGESWQPTLAAAVALVGVFAFLWVILTDLVQSLEQILDLPEPVMTVGPLVFWAGMVLLMAQLMGRGRSASVRWWNLLWFTAAFVLLGANLDFLALAAVLMYFGLHGIDVVDLDTFGSPSTRDAELAL